MIRRTFLDRVISAVFGLTATLFGFLGFASLFPVNSKSLEKILTNSNGKKIDLSQTSETSIQGFLNGKQVLAQKDSHGNWKAISTKCTHLGCSVKWLENQNSFNCPCHGAEFDKNGKVLRKPASEPLDSFSLKVQKNHLVLVEGKNA